MALDRKVLHGLGIAQHSCWVENPQKVFDWLRVHPARAAGNKVPVAKQALSEPLGEERAHRSDSLRLSGKFMDHATIITSADFSQDHGASCWPTQNTAAVPALAAIVSLPSLHLLSVHLSTCSTSYISLEEKLGRNP